MKNYISMRPSYWASVRGGKDSVYMLYHILKNPDKYPLDGVIHFELDIDYPFIKKVIDRLEEQCEKKGIRFVRISPTKTWEEWYNTKYENGSIYGFPTRKVRWCNSKYKLQTKNAFNAFMATQGYEVVDINATGLKTRCVAFPS